MPGLLKCYTLETSARVELWGELGAGGVSSGILCFSEGDRDLDIGVCSLSALVALQEERKRNVLVSEWKVRASGNSREEKDVQREEEGC